MPFILVCVILLIYFFGLQGFLHLKADAIINNEKHQWFFTYFRYS